MNELGFDTKYSPKAMHALGQHCRDWRDQNEVWSRGELDWSVKIYSNEGIRGSLPQRDRTLPPGLILMPLARPPCVLINEDVDVPWDDWISRDSFVKTWFTAV
jgi:hypothetical protein